MTQQDNSTKPFVEKKVKQPVNLQFEPATSEIEIVTEIFDDREARILWMAFKAGHIVSQYFDESCMLSAEALRCYGAADVLAMGEILSKNASDGALTEDYHKIKFGRPKPKDSRDESVRYYEESLSFLTDLFEYLIKGKPFKWNICKPGTSTVEQSFTEAPPDRDLTKPVDLKKAGS